ncbi:C-terminal binding protein AN [Lolium perenne]|uniref:C-terminal binding protein AN n=1 Tax=Lolium perenne TaxID=4522 RepID=UPI0021EB48E8|nr:C-terminal binding protein AN-like [Lolium perenne]
MAHSSPGGGQGHPLVVSLNCLDDPSLEQELLSGVAGVEHVPLSALTTGRVESAAAVLLPSLAALPRAAQRRLRPWQLLLCLGSADRAADAAAAAALGLRLVHVDACRADEVADTVMALFLGLLRRTHLLSRHASSSSSSPAALAAGCLGAVQPLCRGMRRCRGLVLGIVGRSAAARCLATRSLAFRMSVLYFDPRYLAEGKMRRPSIVFPAAARRMDTLNDLLAASDLVSLHCTLTNDTMQILNEDCLQHIKPGAFIVNTGSCQLIDDCALKQLLIDGTIAGCALDGVEGPQWMEAWVREMPNVLILPRSADYSEEVWMEIREKAITILQSFFFDGVVPSSSISDEDEEISEAGNEDGQDKETKDSHSQVFDGEQQTDESHLTLSYEKKRAISQHKEPQASGQSQHSGSRTEVRRSRSGKKGKKRPAHRRSQQKTDDLSAVESDRDDDTAMSGRDQVLSSSSRFASPEDSKYKQEFPAESPMEITSEKKLPIALGRKYPDKLKDGFVVALRSKDNSGFHVARQRRAGGGGWILDLVSNATNRDPAAQFLVTFKNNDTMGLRSFVAGGKLLQINRKTEFVFASHSFDVWEGWVLEGSLMEGCRLINCRNSSAVLDVCIEVLAAASEEDGVTRWID